LLAWQQLSLLPSGDAMLDEQNLQSHQSSKRRRWSRKLHVTTAANLYLSLMRASFTDVSGVELLIPFVQLDATQLSCCGLSDTQSIWNPNLRDTSVG
jgi:hypothetical protein